MFPRLLTTPPTPPKSWNDLFNPIELLLLELNSKKQNSPNPLPPFFYVKKQKHPHFRSLKKTRFFHLCFRSPLYPRGSPDDPLCVWELPHPFFADCPFFSTGRLQLTPCVRAHGPAPLSDLPPLPPTPHFALSRSSPRDA